MKCGGGLLELFGVGGTEAIRTLNQMPTYNHTTSPASETTNHHRMPKANKYSHYGVVKGHDGPDVYDNWPRTEKAVKGYPNNQYKGFTSAEAAQAYVDAEVGD